MIKSLVISSIFLLGFFFIFFVAFRLAFGKNFVKNHLRKWQIIVFSLFAIVGLFAIIHISSHNSGIYAWDSGGYWVWSYKHTDQLFSAPNDAMQNLQDSIINTDYNMLLPTIISLPMKIFGNTFIRYACINYALFFVPTMFILLCLFMKLTEKDKNKNRNFWVGILSLASLSVPLISILQGYIDVAVMIPIALVFALTLSFEPTKTVRGQIGKGLMIGLLLTIMFLFRRYTAFFVVGYAITIAAYCIYMLIIKRKAHQRFKLLIKNLLLNALCVIIPPLVLLFGFFSGLIFRIMGENYAELYSAYNDTFINKIMQVILHFGIIILLFALFGAIISFVKKKEAKISFFCIFSFVVVALLFFRVQSMNGHHIYTITPQVYILLFLGLAFIFSIKKRTILKFLCAFILIVGSISCLSSRVFKLTKPAAALFQLHYDNFLHRDDIDTIHEIRDYLNSLDIKDKIIYVLSSSVVFNSDTLMVMERPLKDNAVVGLVKSHDVDLRDGFPNIFFDANVIVTTTPVGTHLLEGSQEIITYLAGEIQDPDSYLGRHYTKDEKEFPISEGYTVQIYHRTSDLTAEDYDTILNYYDNLYPNQQTIFKDRIEKAKEEHLD